MSEQTPESAHPEDVLCSCGHSVTRHSPKWGCDAYVAPKIGGSGICCTRTPAQILALRLPPGNECECPGSGTLAHVRGCPLHPEATR